MYLRKCEVLTFPPNILTLERPEKISVYNLTSENETIWPASSAEGYKVYLRDISFVLKYFNFFCPFKLKTFFNFVLSIY